LCPTLNNDCGKAKANVVWLIQPTDDDDVNVNRQEQEQQQQHALDCTTSLIALLLIHEPPLHRRLLDICVQRRWPEREKEMARAHARAPCVVPITTTRWRLAPSRRRRGAAVAVWAVGEGSPT